MIDPKSKPIPDITVDNMATRTLTMRGLKTIADLEAYLLDHGAICTAPSTSPITALWAQTLSAHGVPAEVVDWRGWTYLMTSHRRQHGVVAVYGEALVTCAIRHLYNVYEKDLAIASLYTPTIQLFCEKYGISVEDYERDLPTVWHKVETNIRISNGGRGYLPFSSTKLSQGLIRVLRTNGYETPMDVYTAIKITGGISFPELSSKHRKIAHYLKDIGLNVQCISQDKQHYLVEGTKT